MLAYRPYTGFTADEYGGRHPVRHARDRARHAGDGILAQPAGIRTQ